VLATEQSDGRTGRASTSASTSAAVPSRLPSSTNSSSLPVGWDSMKSTSRWRVLLEAVRLVEQGDDETEARAHVCRAVPGARARTTES
jgi:hypothetical protein